ncbi:MAG: MFS transporter [Desulfatiglandales bacterium]|nr:MFS transporter [Desulfatiglandales bacterium]
MAMDSESADNVYKRRWVILGVMYLCVLSFAFALQSLPPVLTLIMAELKLSHAQGGRLMSFFALPGIIISIPAGILADRYSQKTLGAVSLLLVIGGTALVAMGSSLPSLALGRLVSGFGAITLLVIAPQLLAQWFIGREVGIAMGVFNTGMPFGTVLSLNFLSIIGEHMGWRASIWTGAVVSLLTLVVFLRLFTPAPKKDREIPAPPKHLLEELRLVGTSVWLLGAAWLFFNAALISLYTFTPDFLRSSGFSITSAGFYTSAFVWSGVVMGPIIGWLIDKKGRKRLLIGFSGMILSLFLVLFPSITGGILPFILCFGLFQSFIPTPIFALVPDLVHPTRLGLGYGILSTCVNLGIVAGPFATGWVIDLSGSYQASYNLMSSFAILVTVSMLFLGRRSDKPADPFS